MELTPTDRAILRSTLAHGTYSPRRYADHLRALRLVEVQLLRDNDNAPGTYTLTTMGEQLIDKLENA